MIKRVCSIISLILLLMMFYGCGPSRAGKESKVYCYPKDLHVNVNSKKMDISWKINCPKLISGYNIYISETPIVNKYPGKELPNNIKPYNSAPFSGDTNPDDGIEHFIAERLENGKKYYVSVRTIKPDRTLSKPSNEILTVCGPRREIELSVRYESERDGFSFEKNKYVRADHTENDISFYSMNSKDYLISPSKLGGFLKENKLIKLSFKGSFEEIRKRTEQLPRFKEEEKIAVDIGDWLMLITPDRKHALIKVMDITGSGERRRIKLFIAFSPLPDEMIF